MTEALDPADLPLDHEAEFGPMFTRPEQVGLPEPETEEDRQALSDLDPRAMEDFTGLLHLGFVEDRCTIAGHEFVLRTPGHDERLERGNLHKPYLASMNTEPMWRLLTVAAYLISIDDEVAPEPLADRVGPVETRLRWVKRSIFSPVMIGKLFDKTLELDERERNVVEYMDDQVKL